MAYINSDDCSGSVNAGSGEFEKMQPELPSNCAIISGRRCGVQSFDGQQANVFVEVLGVSHYARINLLEHSVEEPMRASPATDFVRQHLAAFEGICARC